MTEDEIADAFARLRTLEAEADELPPTATGYALRRAVFRLREQLTRHAVREGFTGGAR